MSKWELVRVTPDQVQMLVGLARAVEEICSNLPITLSGEEKEVLIHASQWLEQLALENRDLKAQVETLQKNLKDLPLKKI